LDGGHPWSTNFGAGIGLELAALPKAIRLQNRWEIGGYQTINFKCQSGSIISGFDGT